MNSFHLLCYMPANPQGPNLTVAKVLQGESNDIRTTGMVNRISWHLLAKILKDSNASIRPDEEVVQIEFTNDGCKYWIEKKFDSL